MRYLLAALLWAGPAAAATPADKARRLELRESIRDEKRRIKQAALEQHKGLALIREREKADIHLTKASGAGPEALHQALLAVRERWRRESQLLRERRRDELWVLRTKLKRDRAEVAALAAKK